MRILGIDISRAAPAIKVGGTICTLSDPRTGVVRYVGKTLDITKRLLLHIRDRAKNHRTNWIKGLRAAGLMPVLEPVEMVPAEQLDECERFWIEQMRHWGFDLVNGTAGGTGGDTRSGKKSSKEHCRKISMALKGKKKTPEHLERLRQSQLGKSRRPESIAKQAQTVREKYRTNPEKFVGFIAAQHSSKSPESIEKGAAKRRGQKRTPEQKARMSAAAKLRTSNQACRSQHSAALKEFYANKKANV